MKKGRTTVKRMLSFLLAVVLVCTSAPVSAEAAKKPKLNKTSVVVRVGKKVTLKVNRTNKKAKWTIQSGKKYISLKKKKKTSVVVLGKKAGTAKVAAKIGKKKLVCKIKVKAKKTDASAEDNDPVGDDVTQAPETQPPVSTEMPTMEPGNTSDPGSTQDPGTTMDPENPPDPGSTSEPVTTPDPETTPDPGNPPDPGTTSDPGNPPDPGTTPDPGNTPEPGTTPTPTPGNTPEPVVTPTPENPGQEVVLPSGATVFTMGARKLAIGMSEADVYKVLGSSSEQEIRTGKSPQGFDTISYNTKNYSEYLLIYLKDASVVGICGISRSMSFGDVKAGDNGNNLSSSWINISGYKTDSGKVGAKKFDLSGTEVVYAFYDALADNGIYCIQVFDPGKVKDKDNDMIYMTENLSYDSEVTDSIAVEISCMLNAYRVYRSLGAYYLNDGLAQCAKNYCSTITAAKIDPRNASVLLEAMFDCGVDPMNWGECCYYDAADAISFTNSLIEMENFYPQLAGADASKYAYIGVGMASNGKHTYLAVDYVDEI